MLVSFIIPLFEFWGRLFGLSLCAGWRRNVMAGNPRYKNGNLRRKHRARFKAMQAPCGICRGKLGPIHYDEPSDSNHPFSFVIDEIKPVSKWRVYGYGSPEEAAQDWNNLQAAHWCCNAAKSNKVIRKIIISDGKW